MDYYLELEIPDTATQEEIKKAYRRLASQHHPDKGGSTEKFQAISVAYSVLSDPNKKYEYDSRRNRNASQNYSFEFGPNFSYNTEFEDIMEAFIRARSAQQKNKSITINAKITLEQAYSGGNLSIAYRIPGKQTVKTVDVEIPAGVNTGQTLRLIGEGDDSIPNVQPGDLNVSIQILDHERFIRNGDNLYAIEYINAFDAILGTTISVEELDGNKITLELPAGIQPGHEFTIANKGFKNLSTGNRGSLNITIEVTIPKITDEHSLSLIKELNDKITQTP